VPRVAAAITAAAVEVAVHSEALGGVAVLDNLDVGGEGGGGVENHGQVEDAIRKVKAASQAATAMGDDLPEPPHVGEDGVGGEVVRDVGNADVDDGVGGLPAVDEKAAGGGPLDASLEAGEEGGGDVGGAEGEADQFRNRIRQAAEDVGDGDAQVIENEVVPVIRRILGPGRPEVHKKVALGIAPKVV
jgi:hypothetical protein